MSGGARIDAPQSTIAQSACRAVLFDLDGTLLDTAGDLAQALNRLRSERALPPLEYERIRSFVSHGSSALVRLAFPSAPEAEFLELRERLLELYAAAICVHTRPFPGMLELIARLERDGAQWGIVTNKPAAYTEPLLDAAGLASRAGVIVSGDTLAERKPHPRPLLHAAERLGVEPRECVYVGDAERDVLAARAAGMRAVVACFGYLGAGDDPRSWPADAWVDAPLEIYDWLHGALVSQAEGALP
ncbi:MAG TPA: phosphoglycolate phosphatase [Steroidobacteraceae bacterium]|nr:phosphoglycolate phosphatase [Steroidobacteraceae bacterium]